MSIWVTRALEPDERRRLANRAAEIDRRPDVISTVAHYGLYIVVIPMVGGGAIGSLLSAASVSEEVAYPIGIAVAIPGALGLFMFSHRSRSRRRAETKEVAARVRAVKNGRTLTVEPRMAWSITADPDEPTYLLRISKDHFLYLNARALPADWQPCSTLTVTMLEGLPVLFEARCGGDPITVDHTLANVHFHLLADPHVECKLLRLTDLPREWQPRCGACARHQP